MELPFRLQEHIVLMSFVFLIYFLKNEIKPVELKCAVCGKRIHITRYNADIPKTCNSRKCMANNPERNRKIRETCLRKYGVDNVYKFDEVKNKIKNTCLNKYGV